MNKPFSIRLYRAWVRYGFLLVLIPFLAGYVFLINQITQNFSGNAIFQIVVVVGLTLLLLLLALLTSMLLDQGIFRFLSPDQQEEEIAKLFNQLPEQKKKEILYDAKEMLKDQETKNK